MIHKILATILGLLFLLFAAFQYNDPDPQLWITIYAVAALISFAFAQGTRYKLLYLLGLLACIGGAVFFWPPEWHGVGLDPNFKYEVEHARESLGLVIVGGVLLYYYLFSKS